MYNVWYFRTYQTIYPMLLALFFYIFFAVLVGTLGSDRKLGFFPAFIFSLILSPLVGWLITLAYPKIDRDKTGNNSGGYKQDYAEYKTEKGDLLGAILALEDSTNKDSNLFLRISSLYAKIGNVDKAIENIIAAKLAGAESLEITFTEPFDNIKNNSKWIDFVNNNFTLDTDISKPVSSTDELLKLGELLEKGLITREEFDAEKSKLLKR